MKGTGNKDDTKKRGRQGDSEKPKSTKRAALPLPDMNFFGPSGTSMNMVQHEVGIQPMVIKPPTRPIKTRKSLPQLIKQSKQSKQSQQSQQSQSTSPRSPTITLANLLEELRHFNTGSKHNTPQSKK